MTTHPLTKHSNHPLFPCLWLKLCGAQRCLGAALLCCAGLASLLGCEELHGGPVQAEAAPQRLTKLLECCRALAALHIQRAINGPEVTARAAEEGEAAAGGCGHGGRQGAVVVAISVTAW